MRWKPTPGTLGRRTSSRLSKRLIVVPSFSSKKSSVPAGRFGFGGGADAEAHQVGTKRTAATNRTVAIRSRISIGPPRSSGGLVAQRARRLLRAHPFDLA